MSEEVVLLKIYRQFTNDEKVNFLIRKCKERGLEIGKLQSELAEVKHKLDTERLEYCSRKKNGEYKDMLAANETLLRENKKLKDRLNNESKL